LGRGDVNEELKAWSYAAHRGLRLRRGCL